jgi:C_GCAxxG_C_C family probable redox protein
MKKDLGKEAFDYFNNGFCCSEAVSKTIIDRFSDNPDGFPVKAASGFCGGIGRSHEDLCGALAGGVIAVGYLLGRMEQGKDLSKACEVITEFRKSFIGAFGSTNCAAILKSLGEQEKYIKCKQLTGKAAEILAEILEKRLV